MDLLEKFVLKLDEIEEELQENNVDYERDKYQIQFEKWGLSFFMGANFEDIDKDYRIKLEDEDGKTLEKEHPNLGEYISIDFKENLNLSNLDSENVDVLYVYHQSGVIARAYDIPEKPAYIWKK